MTIHKHLNHLLSETFHPLLAKQNRLSPKLGMGLIALTFGITLSGCQNSVLANPTISEPPTTHPTAKAMPTHATVNRIKTTTDITYGTDKRQRLDIYTPDDNQRHPVLIFVYGGSWERGKRQTYAFVGRQFAKAGYITVVMDYRLAPQHIFPDYVTDTAHAMSWVYRNIAQYSGNPEQMFVMGHSAGAFNVVSAIDDDRFWSEAGVPNQAVLGVIGLAGPYDYDFRLGTTQVAFPKDATPQQVMPVYHIRQGIPPHLLVTGEKDTVVYPQNADSLQMALTKAGGQVERLQVPATHVGIVVGLSKPLQPFYPTYDKILDFMQRQLPQNN